MRFQISPTPAIFSSEALGTLIQHCAFTSNSLRKCQQIHAFVVTTSSIITARPFLYNNLITLYAKSNSVSDALLLFDTMPTRNVVSYCATISACSRASGYGFQAIGLLSKMVSLGLRPNGLALASLLHASSTVGNSTVGSLIHTLVVKDGFLNDGAVTTALLTVYSECGRLLDANRVFDEMDNNRDVIAWNAAILGNLKNGSLKNGLRLFCNMRRTDLIPSEFTFSMVFSAFRRIGGDCRNGEIVHGLITKLNFVVDIPLQNSLLDMYCSFGNLDAAINVFKEIEEPGLISWNTLISGYTDNGSADTAIELFVELRALSCDKTRPDQYTYAALVSGIASLPGSFFKYYGKPLHAQIKKVGLFCNVFVGSTLIDMYFKNQEPESASKVFDSILHRDEVLWTGMIVGHSRSGEGEQALAYFRAMAMEGHKLDNFSISSAMNSSAELASLKQGEMIHSQTIKTGYESDICVCGSLIDMYSKNGLLKSADWVFSRVKNPDLKCWNAMLSGYGNHGDAEKAFKVFDEITAGGLNPDGVTFVSLLSACTHCCLVEKGKLYWSEMVGRGLVPESKHYACMVNLLSRAGLLDEAEKMIVESPFAEKLPELWRILLSSA
ncbi:Pentatricopeptide repeat-containing protein [Zostera marina]|uniref:Pentatricopeptide repeat-containing protein n=1 Tax=Zostera marina TaxID=29655 RepID=A0A0K9PN06_ZOSMR|nr:Pentatricopeptide repeat-containing protein [Zostera marina]